MVKHLPASAGDITDGGLISGLERSPGGGNGNPTPVFLPSLLLWPLSHSQTQLNDWAHTHAEQNKMVSMLFNKVLDENEKCVFYLYYINQRNFLANPLNWRAKQSPDQGGLRRALECFPSMMEAIEPGWWNVLYVLRASLIVLRIAFEGKGRNPETS